MPYTVRLPGGAACRISVYCAAWRTLKALPPDAQICGFDWFPNDAAVILRRLREGLHDRINRHLPRYGVGRKWDPNYQIQLARDARAIRDYRTARIVLSGSGLQTAEGRRAAPDVHARMTERAS